MYAWMTVIHMQLCLVVVAYRLSGVHRVRVTIQTCALLGCA